VSLINQVLVDLEKRRGLLPPTAQVRLSGLTAAERSTAAKEPGARRAGLLLFLLVLAGALFIKREDLLAQLYTPAPARNGTVTAAGTTPPAAHADGSIAIVPGAPARDSSNPRAEPPPATGPTVAELTRLAAGKEGSDVALDLRFTAPVDYTLKSDPGGGATLRLAKVNLREGYLQAFSNDGLVHDVQVRHGDGDEVDVRFSLRAGLSAGKTEITAADGGGYRLLVHFNDDGVPPARNAESRQSASARLAGTAAHAGTKGRARRPQATPSPPPAHEDKHELRAGKTPARDAAADAAGRENVVVENEQPGVFHKTMHTPDPVDPKTRLYASATAALRSGNRDQALALGREALAADPTAAAPRLLVATILMEDKHDAEARALLETGLAQAPGNRDYKLLYARLLSETGETGKAIELLTRDAPSPADDPDYHALLAALLQRAGRHGDAIVSYRRLLSVRPQNGLWWMGLGISLSASGQRQQARDAFNHALTDRSLPVRLQQFLNDQLRQLQKAST